MGFKLTETSEAVGYLPYSEDTVDEIVKAAGFDQWTLQGLADNLRYDDRAFATTCNSTRGNKSVRRVKITLTLSVEEIPEETP